MQNIAYRNLGNQKFHFHYLTHERTAWTAAIDVKSNTKEDVTAELTLLANNLIDFFKKHEAGFQKTKWIRFYTLLPECTFDLLATTLKEAGVDCAVSLIRQKPLHPNVPLLVQGLSLLQHDKPTQELPTQLAKELFPESHLYSWVEGGREYIMLSHLIAQNRGDSEKETTEIFEKLQTLLDEMKMTLPEQGLRTWIYIKDIDNNYEGLVVGRRDYFKKIGMTKRFLVSTGIGSMGEDDSIVTIDVLLCKEHSSDQNIFIDAPDFMPHANSYGVTFERSLHYKNNLLNHMLIAGTASIDTEGEILYDDNPPVQTDRIFLILNDLLRQADMKVGEFETLTVYLRDDKQIEGVIENCQKAAPHIPKIFLHAPVCRPGWLVEIEGEATRF